jgi:hypothetical protein
MGRFGDLFGHFLGNVKINSNLVRLFYDPTLYFATSRVERETRHRLLDGFVVDSDSLCVCGGDRERQWWWNRGRAGGGE